MQRFFGIVLSAEGLGVKAAANSKGYNCDLGRKITDEYKNVFRTQSNI